MKFFSALIFFLTTAILGVAQVLWATGYNYYGQLGDGTRTDRTRPMQVASGVAWGAARDFGVPFPAPHLITTHCAERSGIQNGSAGKAA